MSLLKSDEDVLELTQEQFRDFLLRLGSCEEAVKVFPDMSICPVCGSVIDVEGNIYHKPRVLYVN